MELKDRPSCIVVGSSNDEEDFLSFQSYMLVLELSLELLLGDCALKSREGEGLQFKRQQEKSQDFQEDFVLI